MSDVISFLTDNWVAVLAVLIAVQTLGEKVAAATANTVDDKVFSVLHTVFSWLALQKPAAKTS